MVSYWLKHLNVGRRAQSALKGELTMEERRVYYPANPLKLVMLFYNLAILVAGLATSNDLILSAAIFLNLIGIQFHFTIFEDLRDKNLLNRADLVVGIGALVILFVKFFVLTAGMT